VRRPRPEGVQERPRRPERKRYLEDDDDSRPTRKRRRRRPAKPAPLPSKPSKPWFESPPRPRENDPVWSKAGLRAYWAFDEGKGNKAIDSSPDHLEAILHGCKWVPGIRGNAVELNGGSDYVELSNASALNFAERTPLTILAWMKTTQREGMVLSFRHHPDTCDLVNIFVKDGAPVAWVRHAGDPFYPHSHTTGQPVNDGKWHHFAVTRNPDGNVVLHVDGIQKTQARGGRADQNGKLVTNLRTLGLEATNLVGRRGELSPYRFVGCIDELAIFGEVLIDERIRALAGR
jgi:Concanavalin A-like lectin/glucanases superfamily